MITIVSKMKQVIIQYHLVPITLCIILGVITAYIWPITIQKQNALCLKRNVYSRVQSTSFHDKYPHIGKCRKYIPLAVVKMESVTKPYADKPITIQKQYALCLKRNVYSRVQSTSSHDKYPHIGKRTKYIPLAVVKMESVTKDSANKFTSTTLKHGVDEVLRMKEPLEMDDLFKPVSDQPLKFILVEGAPGIGKTTFVKELVKRWANHAIKHFEATVVIQIPLREKTISKSTFFRQSLFGRPMQRCC